MFLQFNLHSASFIPLNDRVFPSLSYLFLVFSPLCLIQTLVPIHSISRVEGNNKIRRGYQFKSNFHLIFRSSFGMFPIPIIIHMSKIVEEFPIYLSKRERETPPIFHDSSSVSLFNLNYSDSVHYICLLLFSSLQEARVILKLFTTTWKQIFEWIRKFRREKERNLKGASNHFLHFSIRKKLS